MSQQHLLNKICPYYTMFPLAFPSRVLKDARPRQLVADPYCGRGTTVYAGRIHGLPTYGIDSSPVAVAISRAKLATTSFPAVMQAYDRLMEATPSAYIPKGNFWEMAYDSKTLRRICRLRKALAQSAASGKQESGAVAMLRAISLGALHGPLNSKGLPHGHFSNQMMRSWAPKPDYAEGFWKTRGMKPSYADIRAIISMRTRRIMLDESAEPRGGYIAAGDSGTVDAWKALPGRIRWVVTSPPYYGMHTYEEDQWLRLWFLGGPSRIRYGNPNQLSHRSPEDFSRALARGWDRIGERAHPELRMVVRFGAIGSRHSDYQQILVDSLEYSEYPWRLVTTRPAGNAGEGRRQSLTMGERGKVSSIDERDFYIRLS